MLPKSKSKRRQKSTHKVPEEPKAKIDPLSDDLLKKSIKTGIRTLSNLIGFNAANQRRQQSENIALNVEDAKFARNEIIRKKKISQLFFSLVN